MRPPESRDYLLVGFHRGLLSFIFLLLQRVTGRLDSCLCESRWGPLGY
jgi:hypothetical protein